MWIKFSKNLTHHPSETKKIPILEDINYNWFSNTIQRFLFFVPSDFNIKVSSSKNACIRPLSPEQVYCYVLAFCYFSSLETKLATRICMTFWSSSFHSLLSLRFLSVFEFVYVQSICRIVDPSSPVSSAVFRLLFYFEVGEVNVQRRYCGTYEYIIFGFFNCVL